jgi:hypothetical protein
VAIGECRATLWRQRGWLSVKHCHKKERRIQIICIRRFSFTHFNYFNILHITNILSTTATGVTATGVTSAHIAGAITTAGRAAGRAATHIAGATTAYSTLYRAAGGTLSATYHTGTTVVHRSTVAASVTTATILAIPNLVTSILITTVGTTHRSAGTTIRLTNRISSAVSLTTTLHATAGIPHTLTANMVSYATTLHVASTETAVPLGTTTTEPAVATITSP